MPDVQRGGSLVDVVRGPERICTAVDGFAGRCLTTRPPGLDGNVPVTNAVVERCSSSLVLIRWDSPQVAKRDSGPDVSAPRIRTGERSLSTDVGDSIAARE